MLAWSKDFFQRMNPTGLTDALHTKNVEPEVIAKKGQKIKEETNILQGGIEGGVCPSTQTKKSPLDYPAASVCLVCY